MRRIPAPGVVAALSTVSVFTSLCVLGNVASGSPASAASATSAIRAAPVGAVTPAISSLQPLSGEDADTTSVFVSPATSSWLDSTVESSTQATTPVAASGLPATQGTQATTPSPAPQPATPAPASAKTGLIASSPRALAQGLAAQHGWAGAQWVCLDELWEHESKYETTARNASSGAYGIPQSLPASKMAAAGTDWRTNPVTQIRWGLGYIAQRYGTPCGAWQHWERAGSY